MLKQRTKMLIERAMEVEIADHLGHGKSGEVTNDADNGQSAKTLKANFG